MTNKTIFQKSFDPPIHKGKVSQYNMEKMTGIVTTDQGEEIFFANPCELIQTGNLVTCNKRPFVHNPNRYYAKHIRKAYLSQDGYLVSDSRGSHVHDDLKKRLSSIVKRISCKDRRYFYENIWSKDVIGMSSCVPITWEDEIVYAKRVGRDRYSKFVKHRNLIPTKSITIFLKKKQDIYLIMSCYYGEQLAEADLYSLDPFVDERQSFWNDHALVFGSEPIDPTTITTTCPWSGINENNRLGSIYKNFNSANRMSRS